MWSRRTHSTLRLALIAVNELQDTQAGGGRLVSGKAHHDEKQMFLITPGFDDLDEVLDDLFVAGKHKDVQGLEKHFFPHDSEETTVTSRVQRASLESKHDTTCSG